MLTSRFSSVAVRRGPLLAPMLSRSTGTILCMGLRGITSSAQYRSSLHPKTTKLTPKQGNEILDKQRLNRPISPHLEVYRLSQTYLGSSAWMRITGSGVLVVGYAYFAAYLFSPLVGVDIGSASLVSAFAGLPWAVKTGIKFSLAWPFSFHFCNGIKQLLYDSGWAYPYNKITMSRNDVYVFVVSTVVALGLVFGF